MAITTSQITADPGMQWFPAGDALHFSVAVPANGYSLGCYADSQGATLLATVAPGSTANFVNFGGFFYNSTNSTGATVTAASQKIANVTAFTTVKTTATETVTGQVTIPAGVLFSGAVVKVRTQILCTSVNATPTLQGALYLGPNGTTADTALFTASTTAILANGVQTGEFEFIVGAAPGAAVPILGQGSYALAGAPPTTVESATLPSTNFATNATQYLTLTIKWSASNAANIASGNMFVVEIV